MYCIIARLHFVSEELRRTRYALESQVFFFDDGYQPLQLTMQTTFDVTLQPCRIKPVPGKPIATMAVLLRAWNSSTIGCSRGGPQCDPSVPVWYTTNIIFLAPHEINMICCKAQRVLPPFGRRFPRMPFFCFRWKPLLFQCMVS